MNLTLTESDKDTIVGLIARGILNNNTALYLGIGTKLSLDIFPFTPYGYENYKESA